MSAAARVELIEDGSLQGGAFCARYSATIDTWLAQLFASAAGEATDLALVAIGGYGRAELSPRSDIDVMLLHRGGDVTAIAEALWYPIWDDGLKLGHSVQTIATALDLASSDLDMATALLHARPVAGDVGLAEELRQRAREQWQRRAEHWRDRLHDSLIVRHKKADEVAFLLEPELKIARGGLRDVHTLGWLGVLDPDVLIDDRESIEAAHEILLRARVELHRSTGRAGDQLVLEQQDGVAERLGYEDADRLMGAIASSARTIAFVVDETFARRPDTGRLARFKRPERLGRNIVVREGQVHLEEPPSIEDAPYFVLDLAIAAAERGLRIARASIDELVRLDPTFPEPWPPAMRERFVRLLAAGGNAIPVVEALDHGGLLVALLPEWNAVRCKPQRNAYHRYTVDRHLLEAAANAAELVDRVNRPDLLLLGALLHDIGKGFPGDHTDVGIELVEVIGPRMGLDAADTVVLQDLVRHHLLLPDVATRRDLHDDATIRLVADAVGSRDTLALLTALTEADSEATGPAAWGDWKASLVGELSRRVDHVLGGAQVSQVTGDEFPTEELRSLMAAREERLIGEDRSLTVVSRDRPGVFSRIAGALALHGLDVLEAAAHSSEDMALARFTVESPFGSVDWDRVGADVRRALDGRLAIDARLEQRAQTYAKARSASPGAIEPDVIVDNAASDTATVVEVRTGDEIGLLYRITAAMAHFDLDITTAKVQTLGDDVVDAFYVTDRSGAKLDDVEHGNELRLALAHALGHELPSPT